MSCGKKSEGLSHLQENNFELELFDSIVVDYIGKLALQDVSPNGRCFLAYDQVASKFVTFSDQGQVIGMFVLKGEGPGKYGNYHTGKPVFIDNESFLLSSNKGQFQYSLKGDLLHHFEPDFEASYRFIVPSAKNTVAMKKGFVSILQGRYNDLGVSIEHQLKSRQLEYLDISSGKFIPIVPFPAKSKFSSDQLLFHDVYVRPILASEEDMLFVTFSNESRLYGYKEGEWEEPAWSVDLPIENFVEAKGIEADKTDFEFDITQFYFGGIQSLDVLTDSLFLIKYSEGLPLDEVKSLQEQHKDEMEVFFQKIAQLNKTHFQVLEGNKFSHDIQVPDPLGVLSLVQERQYLWFDLDYEQKENDYSVFYKCKLIEI
ncbi:hypothetical protein IFO69_05940 [Echinicola sp. CAU 1574]|uniref:DUF4221 domain-containing protein n=1 Tax=Echinicola arenosa TaxID=2774144 RepID=A0ABR9AHS2_9BACT|nr:hypothetical protein [Echinicola arenosa]MBD8488281.1 hypothetical protein [Echinicola arenosa]